MEEKQLKGRFQQKTDTSQNWEKAGNNGFIPKKGEIIVYQDDTNSKIKIGDGVTNVNILEFSSGEADLSLVKAHIENKDNPHEVTAEQIGAAIASEVGSLTKKRNIKYTNEENYYISYNNPVSSSYKEGCSIKTIYPIPDNILGKTLKIKTYGYSPMSVCLWYKPGDLRNILNIFTINDFTEDEVTNNPEKGICEIEYTIPNRTDLLELAISYCDNPYIEFEVYEESKVVIADEIKGLSNDVNNHKNDTLNPHNVTAEQIGIEDVDNLVVKNIVYEATPETLIEIIRKAQPNSTIQLLEGNYDFLLTLTSKEKDGYFLNGENNPSAVKYPDNLTIIGSENVQLKGVSITSGVLVSEINQDFGKNRINGDISNAILSKNLTFKNINFTNNFCLRNASVDNLVINNCSFYEGSYVIIDPNIMWDCYGKEVDVSNFTSRYPYAELKPKNLVIRDCYFENANNNNQTSGSGTAAIRIRAGENITIYNNIINGATNNGINFCGEENKSYPCGKISITNNKIKNIENQAIRLVFLKDAIVYMYNNDLYNINISNPTRDNYIKANYCTNVQYVIGTGNGSNTYEGTQIGINNYIIAESDNLVEEHFNNFDNPHKITPEQIKAASQSDLETAIDNINLQKVGQKQSGEIFNDYTNNSASGLHSHAEGRYATASGVASHTEGSSNKATGNYAHAEGNYTSATAQNAHAEGYGTYAIKNSAHAEGSDTHANGLASHAEGSETFSVGDYSHSEGQSSRASGLASHAEGVFTYANGKGAHSEGNYTNANSSFSHAEGIGTSAYAEAQHVQGKYNIINDKLAHILGNGTDTNNRSNAHTIDWDGNGWFSGNLKVGGTKYEDANAKSIATEEYVNESIAKIPISDEGIKFKVVPELPTEEIDEKAIYFVPNKNQTEQNIYDEYIYTNNAWECIGSTSVEVNLDEYVKNTNYATADNAGVIKVVKQNGLDISESGKVYILMASNAEINAKTSEYKPITPRNLDYSVMKALTEPQKHTWTEEEKTSARDMIGATSKQYVDNAIANIPAGGSQIQIITWEADD